ncbi:hypothetical protein G6O67_003537 [Ophiocordyceps sinensis]|uniref:Uncharacterized protein n=1 Tax=Ophiocordyceps sinensis TaxID=72228 RepID=A0A8H4V644_9HYPO|nr:hypothetical protein G6O67_003537 [Ophiocordyceps sinensis]
MKVLMHTYFLGLAAVGYDALWGSMVRNGTAQAIGAVKTSGLLPDGSPLRNPVPSLFRLLASPVIFYDSLTRDGNPVHRSLLVSLFSTMQTTAFCIVAGGGTRPWLTVLESLFWGVWNQSYGAAFVYPLYFLAHLHRVTDDSAERHAPSTEQAEALLYTSIIAAVLPAWLIYPAFFSCSSETRQTLIASYRLSPAVLALAQPVIAGMIRRLRARPRPSSSSRALVQSSLLVSGLCSALGHLYALGYAISSSKVTLQAIFWPWATSVDPSGSAIIAQGCHLFLQNDWLVICAAVVPYASAVLASTCRRLEANTDGSWVAWAENSMRSLNGRYVALTAMTAVFSPGAVLAWTMATRA